MKILPARVGLKVATRRFGASSGNRGSELALVTSLWTPPTRPWCAALWHPKPQRDLTAHTIHNLTSTRIVPQFATPKALFGAAASLTRGAADLGREATGAAVAHAKKSMSIAIETATLEYDDAGNALVTMEAEGAEEGSAQHLDGSSQEHDGDNAAGVPASPLVRAQLGYPATPGSALSDPDVSAQLARLLEEREDLRCRVEEQKAQIDQRLAEHLQTASQREQHFAQQLRAAADREQARVGLTPTESKSCSQQRSVARSAGVGATRAAGRGAHAGRARGRAAS